MRFLEKVIEWIVLALFFIVGILFFVSAIVWAPLLIIFILRWGTKVLFFLQTKFGYWFTFEELEEGSGVRGKALELALNALSGNGNQPFVIRRIKPDKLEEILDTLGEKRVKNFEETAHWFLSPKDTRDLWEFSLVRKTGGKRKIFPKIPFGKKWVPQHS